MLASALRRLPRGTFALAAVRLMVYLGVQAAYFIGIIGTLTYQLQAGTFAIAGAVGLFNLFIIIGNAAGGSALDLYGPRVHTVVTLGMAAVSSILFQLVSCTVTNVLIMSAGFGFSAGLGFAFLSAYPAYLSDDAEVLKRVNALLSVVSNTAVMVGPAVGGIIAAVLPSQRVFVFAGALAVAAAIPAVALLRRAECARGRRRASNDVEEDPSAQTSDDAASGTFADSARTVFAVPSLALLFWVGVLAYAGYGAFDPLESLYYRDVLHVEISWMGWLSSAAGVGSVIGAALAMRVPRRHVNVRTLMMLIALEGAACVLYVGTHYMVCAMAGQLLLGAAFGAVTPLQNTLVQIHAPLTLLGRVNSVMNAGFNGAGVLPLFAAPVLADLFGVQAVLVGASCLVLFLPIACMVGMRRKIARIVADET